MSAKTEPVLGLLYGWLTTDVYNTQMDQNWLLLGSACQLSVVAIADDPPVTPVATDRYIVGTAPTGAWVGHAGAIATYLTDEDEWFFLVPQVGWHADVQDTPIALQYRYAGAGVWEVISFATAGEINTASNMAAEPGALYKDKVAYNLRFKVIRSGSDDVEVTANADGQSVDINAKGISRMESGDSVADPVVEILGDISITTGNRVIKAIMEEGTDTIVVDNGDGTIVIDSWGLTSLVPPDVDTPEAALMLYHDTGSQRKIIKSLVPNEDLHIAESDTELGLNVRGIAAMDSDPDIDAITLLGAITGDVRRIRSIKAGANTTLTLVGDVIEISSTGGGGGISDPGSVIDLILTDGTDVLVDSDGSVMYFTGP